jgi:phosphatidylserine/phosphatidylglycerophosphate/cardiolipin synthase-like enzyme
MQEIIIGREYPQIVIPLIQNAKQSIKILIYDWRWYGNDIGSSIQKFNYEILQARRRGVDICAMVNSDHLCNLLRLEGIQIKKVDTKKTMHIKMLIIDDQLLVIGSHNLTKNAFELNHEISILLDDDEVVAHCIAFFEQIK